MTLVLGIIGVIALVLLAWQVFVRLPATLNRRDQAQEGQPDWLTGGGDKDDAISGSGAVGDHSGFDGSADSSKYGTSHQDQRAPLARTPDYKDHGQDPDEYQELVNVDLPSNTALVQLTAFEAEHCAMIIGAYLQGQTGYEPAALDVRWFLLAAAASARHPDNDHLAQVLASRRDAVMNWPFPRPGGPRAQPR